MRARAIQWALITLVFILARVSPSRAIANPFDPSGYIDNKETQKTQKAGTLTSQGVYRINGQRYLQYVSPEGSVFLPGAGTVPEMHEEFAVCPQHLRLMNEVLPTREGLPVERESRHYENLIIAMIRKCNEGRIAGPVRLEQQPDGAVVEVKPKDKAAKARDDAATKQSTERN